MNTTAERTKSQATKEQYKARAPRLAGRGHSRLRGTPPPPDPVVHETAQMIAGSMRAMSYQERMRALGGRSAVAVFDRLLFWCERYSAAPGHQGGWILLTADELQKQTGYGRTAQAAAFKALQDRGVIAIDFRGVPRKRHVRVVWRTALAVLGTPDKNNPGQKQPRTPATGVRTNNGPEPEPLPVHETNHQRTEKRTTTKAPDGKVETKAPDENDDNTQSAGVCGRGGQAGSLGDTLSVPDRPRATPLPEGWTPNAASRGLLASVLGLKGAAAEAEVARFRHHYQAKGALACDWDAQLQGWIRHPLTSLRFRPATRRGKSQAQDLTPEQRDRFARFWDVYPKHTNRRAAEREWALIAPDDRMTAEIVTAVEEQCAGAFLEVDEDRYIPDPANWLRGERWLDEDVDWTSIQASRSREDGIHPTGPNGRWTVADQMAKAQRLREEEGGVSPFDSIWPQEQPAPAQVVVEDVIEVPVTPRERPAAPERDIAPIVRMFEHLGCPLTNEQQARVQAGAEPGDVLTDDQLSALYASRTQRQAPAAEAETATERSSNVSEPAAEPEAAAEPSPEPAAGEPAPQSTGLRPSKLPLPGAVMTFRAYGAPLSNDQQAQVKAGASLDDVLSDDQWAAWDAHWQRNRAAQAAETAREARLAS